MSGTRYRFVVYLTEADWERATVGFAERCRRFRAAKRLAQVERVSSAMTEAESDCWPYKDEFKYALYLTEADYRFLSEAVTNRRNGVPRDAVERIARELSMAAGDATEL